MRSLQNILLLANNFPPKNNKHVYQRNGGISIFSRSDPISITTFLNLLNVRPFIVPFVTFCLLSSKEIDLAWAIFAFLKRQGFFLCYVSHLIPFLFISKGKRLLVYWALCFVDPISMELQLTALFGFSGFCFCLVLTVDERSG